MQTKKTILNKWSFEWLPRTRTLSLPICLGARFSDQWCRTFQQFFIIVLTCINYTSKLTYTKQRVAGLGVEPSISRVMSPVWYVRSTHPQLYLTTYSIFCQHLKFFFLLVDSNFSNSNIKLFLFTIFRSILLCIEFMELK